MSGIFLEKILEMLKSGLFSLVDYLSFHVLLCLIPAFFIAGAIERKNVQFLNKLLNQEKIKGFL